MSFKDILVIYILFLFCIPMYSQICNLDGFLKKRSAYGLKQSSITLESKITIFEKMLGEMNINANDTIFILEEGSGKHADIIEIFNKNDTVAYLSNIVASLLSLKVRWYLAPKCGVIGHFGVDDPDKTCFGIISKWTACDLKNEFVKNHILVNFAMHKYVYICRVVIKKSKIFGAEFRSCDRMPWINPSLQYKKTYTIKEPS